MNYMNCFETSGDFCAVDKILETEPITFTRYLKELMKTYQISEPD